MNKYSKINKKSEFIPANGQILHVLIRTVYVQIKTLSCNLTVKAIPDRRLLTLSLLARNCL